MEFRAFVYFLMCAVLAVHPGGAVDYCHLKSCQGHTMCIYGSQPAGDCNVVERVGLTSNEQQQILRTHNDLRATVASGNEKRGAPGPQPAASNLGPLAWDNELAQIAQRWANQCRFGHDKCRNSERFYVGQNVASSSTTGPNNIDVTGMVKSWYEEVKDFNRNQVSRFTDVNNGGKAVGHYTQLVWADTKYVGCGSVKYRKSGWNSTYLVCNYGPGGNIIGSRIYQTR